MLQSWMKVARSVLVASATSVVVNFVPPSFQTVDRKAGAICCGRSFTPMASIRHSPHLRAEQREERGPGPENDSVAVRRSETLSAAVASLQTRFRPGDYYVWLYRDLSGSPTSWERYSFCTTDPGDESVTIEMATKFHKDESYFTHHRMKVDLAANLLSQTREEWQIRFEYLDDHRQWTANGVGDNVQAFEEKFNIFLMLDPALLPLPPGNITPPDTKDAMVNKTWTTLLRPPRHAYTKSWYAPYGHRLAGVALQKEFDFHSFELIAVGRGPVEPQSVHFGVSDCSLDHFQ